MSASRILRSALGWLLLGSCGVVLAADEVEAPDIEFLEYLGMWEESDDEWLIVEKQPVADAAEERTEPVPEGEVSTEKEDES